jgi:tyrosine-protein kinase Etk/Wzc
MASPTPRRTTVEAQDLQILSILRVLSRYRTMIFTISAIVVTVAVADHFIFPVYKARAALAILSPQNSLAQATSARLGGFGPTELIAAQSPADRYSSHLHTFGFFQAAARRIAELPEMKVVDPDIFGRRRALRLKFRSLFLRENSALEIKTIPIDTLAEAIENRTSVSTVGQDGLQISVTAPKPGLAKVLANVLAEVAVDTLAEVDEHELNDAEGYIKVELQRAEREIDRIDGQIAGSSNAGTGLLMSMAKEDSARKVIELQESVYELSIEIDQVTGQLASLQKQTGVNPPEGEKGPYKFGRLEKLRELKAQLDDLVRRRDAAKSVLGELSKTYDPHYEQQIFGLRRKLEMEYALYESLSKEMFTTEVRRISVRNAVRVHELARDNDVEPSRGLASTILIALVLSFLVSAPVAYTRELLLPTISGRGELDDLGMIFLGLVPHMRTRVKHKKRPGELRAVDEHPLCRFDVETQTSLAFIAMRTRLLALGGKFGERSKTIAVTSPGVGEGKSYIARNLASALAYRKQRTLLIDGDMRRRSSSLFFHADVKLGIADVLLGEAKFGDVVKKDVAPYLDLLPSGLVRNDVSDLLTQDYFRQLLDDLSTVYTHIVIDTPPVNAVPDAMILSRFVDQVIMVARQQHTRVAALGHAIDSVSGLIERRVYSVLNGTTGATESSLYIIPSSDEQSRAL